MKKKGFSLIEVVVALLISSMLLVALYQMFRQVQRSVISINNVIDIDTPLITMYDRFQSDIDGMIVPSSYKAELKALQEKEKKASPASTSKKLEHVFDYSLSDKKMKLTFLTTGGIKLIDTSTDSSGKSSPIVALKPYIRRVYYALEPDAQNPGTYTLLWGQSEGSSGSLDDIAALKKFELAWGIKELSMSFAVYDVPESSDTAKGKPTLVTLTTFNAKEVFEKYKTYVPAFITIKGVVSDQRSVRQQDFAFEFSVPAYTIPAVEKTSADEQQAPKAPDEKPAEAKNNKPTKPDIKQNNALGASSTTSAINPGIPASTNGTVAYNEQRYILKL